MLTKKIKGITAVFIISALFAIIAVQLPKNTDSLNTFGKSIQYILDAGHGVPDGGTVGEDGTTEQELNLKITLKLSKLLDDQMISHILTRPDENSIYTEGKTIHAKKVSDVRNRIAISMNNPQASVVSIHMNSYPNPSVCGTQVFYKEGDTDSKKLAERLQRAFNEQLQPDRPKSVKPISKNVYFFSHINNSSVLIECGFLSNPAELQKLKSENHQNEIAQIIAEALIS